MEISANEISVLIPTYNRPGSLKECLESIVNQTKMPREVIIVDASPSMDSKNVLTNYYDKGFYIQYFRSKPNKIEQRNFGASKATGKLLQLSDDDIVFDSKYFEIVQKYLNELNDEKFGGFIGSIFENESGFLKNQHRKFQAITLSRFQKIFLIYPFGKGKLLKSGQHQIIHNNIIGEKPFRITIMGGASCYKKNIFNNYSFSNDFKEYAVGEDIDFSLQVGLNYNLYYFPQAIFYHKHLGIKSIAQNQKMVFKKSLHKYIFYKYKNEYKLSKIHYLWARVGLLFMDYIKKN